MVNDWKFLKRATTSCLFLLEKHVLTMFGTKTNKQTSNPCKLSLAESSQKIDFDFWRACGRARPFAFGNNNMTIKKSRFWLVGYLMILLKSLCKKTNSRCKKRRNQKPKIKTFLASFVVCIAKHQNSPYFGYKGTTLAWKRWKNKGF